MKFIATALVLSALSLTGTLAGPVSSQLSPRKNCDPMFPQPTYTVQCNGAAPANCRDGACRVGGVYAPPASDPNGECTPDGTHRSSMVVAAWLSGWLDG
ncbi:MAG: hypothetical protein M1836_002841 [Candelina mexicana]|nr:MAG: hypothetical protein M1836_002841 [Candelina mexicana]